MNWKFRVGVHEHTGVSELQAHMPNNSRGGYTRVHQDTAGAVGGRGGVQTARYAQGCGAAGHRSPVRHGPDAFCELTDVPFGSERMHTVTNQMAQELTVVDVAAPTRGDYATRGRSRGGPLASSGDGPGHRWSLCPNASRQRP